MRWALASAATLFFVCALLLVYAVHVSFFAVDVIFYAAIFDAVLASVVSTALIQLSWFRLLNRLEKAQLVLIWLLAGYAFAISVPTVIDRSLSVYLLEKLQQRGGGIKESSFPELFSQEYMVEHRLVDVRLTEQLASGTVHIRNGCVMLTDKGRLIARITRYFRRHWLPSRRLLSGSYRDDLTDPFRSSSGRTDYVCGEVSGWDEGVGSPDRLSGNAVGSSP